MIFATIRESLRRRRVSFLACMAAATAARASGIPLAFGARRLLRVAGHGGDMFLPAALLVGVALARGGCRWFHVARGEALALEVIAELRVRMAEHLMRLPLGWFDRKRTGSMILRFVGDAGSLRAWIARTVITMPADALTLIAALGALATISPVLVVCAAAPLALLVPLHLSIDPRARELTRDARRVQSRLSGRLGEAIDDPGPWKVAGPGRMPAGVHDGIQGIADRFGRRARLDAMSRGAALATGSLAAVITSIAGAMLLRAGDATPGDLLVAVWITLIMRGPVVRLTQANVNHQRARVAVERIDALLERAPEPGLDDAEREAYDGSGMRIRLKNLGYRDRDGTWPVRGLDETLEGPGLVVVTGVARGAKRLFELILRLRRPHEGTLALDGKRASRLSTDDVRRSIAWHDPGRVMASLSCDGDRCVLDAVTRGRHVVLLHDPTAGLATAEAADARAWITTAARTRLVLAFTHDEELTCAADRVVLPQPGEGAAR